MVVIIGQRWAKDLKNKPNHSVTTIYAQTLPPMPVSISYPLEINCGLLMVGFY